MPGLPGSIQAISIHHGSMSGGNGILITEAVVTDQISRLADNKAAGSRVQMDWILRS